MADAHSHHEILVLQNAAWPEAFGMATCKRPGSLCGAPRLRHDGRATRAVVERYRVTDGPSCFRTSRQHPTKQGARPGILTSPDVFACSPTLSANRCRFYGQQ